MHGRRMAVVVIACAVLCPSLSAAAQDPEGGDVSLTSETRIKSRQRANDRAAGERAAGKRATRKRATGRRATGRATQRSPRSANRAGHPRGTEGVRVGVQVRLDAFNTLGAQTSLGGGGVGVGSGLTPIVTPGARLLDQRLYLGLGLGLVGYSDEAADGSEESRSSFLLAPMAMFDVLADDWGALSLGGWLTFSSLGETESCASAMPCQRQNDGQFAWGINLMAGVRGQLGPGIALGGEFGWGFLRTADDGGGDRFLHGLVGLLLLEASVGL